jgi:integrase
VIGRSHEYLKKRYEKFVTVQKLRDVLRNRDASEDTYLNYLRAIAAILKYQPQFTDPDYIIKQLGNDKAKAVELFKNFIAAFAPQEWNGEWKIKKTSLRLLVAGLKKFLRANNVHIYNEDIKDIMPKIVKHRKCEAPSKQVLNEMLHYLNLRGKTVLGLASGSGLRIGTILALQLRDIDYSQNPVTLKIPYTITQVKDGKEQVLRRMKGAQSDDTRVHTTFMTPECREWLQSYLDYRQRQGEKLTPSSPVITYNVSKKTGKTKLGQFISYWAAWSEMRHTLRKAGYVEQRGRAKIHPHAFRAYFRTMLTQAGLSEPDIEVLMAHQGGYLQVEYYRPNIEHLKEQYESAIRFLSITSGSIDRSVLEKQANEITKLQKTATEQANLIDELKAQVTQLQDIREIIKTKGIEPYPYATQTTENK